jgi:hypothetical protein
MVAGFKSERWPTSNRNPRPASIGIHKHRNEYQYFENTESDAEVLYHTLNEAEEVISFNGENFDFLVLEKHFGSRFSRLLFKFRHIDMMIIARTETEAGFNFSLHKLALLNLGVGKMTKSRDMAALTLDDLKIACRSDVEQTYRLWQLWRDRKIKYPAVPTRQNIGEDEFADPGPGSQLTLPKVCPGCGTVRSFIVVDPNIDDLTDGQQADYFAGWRRDLMCRFCQMLVIDGEPVGRLTEIVKDLGLDKTPPPDTQVIVFPTLQKAMNVASAEHRYKKRTQSKIKPLVTKSPARPKRPK